MKKAIPATILAALAMVAAAPLADAKPHHRGKKYYPSSHVYVSGYRSCGTPIYQERYVRYYQRCGTPVWGYRVVSPPYRQHYVEPRYHHHYEPPVCVPPPCPPPPCHSSGPRVIVRGIFGF